MNRTTKGWREKTLYEPHTQGCVGWRRVGKPNLTSAIVGPQRPWWRKHGPADLYLLTTQSGWSLLQISVWNPRKTKLTDAELACINFAKVVFVPVLKDHQIFYVRFQSFVLEPTCLNWVPGWFWISFAPFLFEPSIYYWILQKHSMPGYLRDSFVFNSLQF